MFRADATDAADETGHRLARAQPHTRVRGAVARGGAQAGGHPGVDQARGTRHPHLDGERQGQGRDRAGLRVPKHRRPHGPRDARMLGPEARAARKGGGNVISYPHELTRPRIEKMNLAKVCLLRIRAR